MYSSNQLAVQRRRVKTGCLACRKRRRKCDETRPKCINCIKRGATCQYSNFKSISLQAPSREDNDDPSSIRSPSSGTLQRSVYSGRIQPPQPLRSSSDAFAYNAIVLSDDELNRRETRLELPSTSEVNQDPSTETRPGQSERVNEPVIRTLLHPIPSITWNTTIAETSNSGPSSKSADKRSYNIPWPHSTTIITDDSGSGNFSEEPQTSTSLRTSTNGSRLCITTQEDVQLLLHYRYHLAPWLDVNNPRAFFGIELLSTSRDSPIIMSTILKLAAMHKNIMSSTSGTGRAQTYDEENMSDFEELLAHETTSVQRKCRLLLRIGKSFGLGPRGWRGLASESSDYLGANLIDILEEPLFAWCFQIDLAAAIVDQQPLLTDVHVSNMWRRSKRASALDDVTRYESFFFILAECLRLKSAEQRGFSSALVSCSLPQQVFSTRWLSLWNECQLWYQNRPPEICQFLSCRSVEAGIIDPDSTALFPIEIFLSPLALVQNVAYHIASILLLTSKPRLVELQATSGQASSKAWHMHSIAGACERNDFAEQWDPVLIAGLLLIGPNMTHDSQQKVLLQCFRRATRAIEIDLTDEILNLQACWQP